jgi:hypothetical protein
MAGRTASRLKPAQACADRFRLSAPHRRYVPGLHRINQTPATSRKRVASRLNSSADAKARLQRGLCVISKLD